MINTQGLTRPPDILPATALSELAGPEWTYRDVLENIHVGVIVLDTGNCSLEYRNPASAAMFRGLGEPPTYQALHELLRFDRESPDQAWVAGFSRTIHHHNRLYGYRIYQIDARKICLFIHDITVKARLESIAQAVNTMDNIGIIFSGIRHEIGNPLNSIKMTMSVLRANLQTFPPDTVIDYVDRSLAEIARVEYLLKALKNFNMFEKVEIRELNLVAFIEKFLDLVALDFEKLGIPIQFSPPPDAIPALVDQRALHQVLLNLLANASDALKQTEYPEIRLSLQQVDELVWLQVQDNGCGMDAEQLSHLFQPFYTNKANGNGLGLAITRKLLAGMKGSIEIASDETGGTTATISLPAASDQAP